MTNRPILQRYGMWDQLRVDQGKEWYLMLFVQEQLAHLRYNTSRAPHLQTTSKKVIPMVHLCGCPHSPCIYLPTAVWVCFFQRLEPQCWANVGGDKWAGELSLKGMPGGTARERRDRSGLSPPMFLRFLVHHQSFKCGNFTGNQVLE